MIEKLRQGLIVSCQAPANSPLHDPLVIAAMAQASVNQGAVGVRIDTPAHVKAVRVQVGQDIPIIGLWKREIAGYEVYITPLFEHAVEIATAGADIIAIDATLRNRPEPIRELIRRIHDQLGKLVMADVDTVDAAKAAEAAGADMVGTTLYGYTKATENLSPPAFEILPQMVEQVKVPVICEGGISTPAMAKKALDLGADIVVVGTAITGIDEQVKAYVKEMSNRS